MSDQISVPLRAVVRDARLALEAMPETLPSGALDRPVRWAHVCELLDPAPYLLGDELLLTAGVNLPSERADIDRYVRRLRDAGVAALGFGITPPLHTALPEALRRSCGHHGLPLLVVPERVPFLAVSRAVSVALSEAARREELRVARAREALIRAAEHGVAEVAAELGRRLGAWVCLVTTRDRPVAAYRAPRPLPVEAVALLARARAGSGPRSASAELPDGTVLVAQPVSPQASATRLVLVGRPVRLGASERAILGVGAGVLGLVGEVAADAAALGALATDLLLSQAEPNEVLREVLGPGEYRVLAGAPHRAGPAGPAAGYLWLRTRLGTPLVSVTTGPRFVAIVPTTADLAVLDELLADGWLAVAGRPVPAQRLVGSLAEVEVLRSRALSLGRPVRAGAGGLPDVVAPAAAAAFAARWLDPLREADRSRPGDQLIETLRTWLAQHGGWDRTAAALGIHRNSVRHRIARVERALGADLADPDVRMELWFALRWTTDQPPQWPVVTLA